MANDDEIAELKAWKKYRLLIIRVVTSLAPDVTGLKNLRSKIYLSLAIWYFMRILFMWGFYARSINRLFTWFNVFKYCFLSLFYLIY